MTDPRFSLHGASCQPRPDGSRGGAWQELRDDRGKLYGRIEPTMMLLEIRRAGVTATFDLRGGTMRGVTSRDKPPDSTP